MSQSLIIFDLDHTLYEEEEDAIERKLNALGIPTFFRLHGNATAEGGDMLWLDEKTLAIHGS